ncbi:MAG: hypothetical protein NC418_06690 [Muribaculaceae bacterium]|nr:hypothetical protein [Muribaculaceae bacterium]
MKKIIAALALCLCTSAMQARTTMKYQALVCDEAGKAMPNAQVSLKVAIHQGSADGENVLGEVYSTVTSPAGVAYINIGEQSQGTTLDDLDWAGTTYFLELSIDRGEGFVSTGSQQILSVPRAIHAATAQAVVLTSPSGKKFKVTINENGELSTEPLAE